MRKRRTALSALAGALLILTALPALAQSSSTSRPTSGSDRLFLSFAEDATIVDGQWWEGQLELSEGDVIDTKVVRGVVAFRLRDDIEVGGRVGFGDSDTCCGLPDGSGATDLEAWAKYHLGQSSSNTEFAVGGTVTVPTGDDTAGLGLDAFSLGGFGALRHRLDDAIISANIGLRINGDAMFLGGPERDSKVSVNVGVGVIIPTSDRLAFVAEVDMESERFDGGDTNSRLLGGVNWRIGNQTMIRGAIAFGLDDGAPDTQLIGAYAYHF